MFKIFQPNNFLLFPFIVGLAVYFNIKIKTSNNSTTKEKEEIINRERQALFIPQKPLPEDFVITPNKDLPFDSIVITDKNKLAINRLKEDILNLYEKKLLNPSINLTNIELKEAFGHKSIDDVIEYEKNYSKYIISLNSIAKVLIDSDQPQTAESFLLEAINIGSDVSKTYIYLIDIYNKTSKEKLESFITNFKENIDSSSFLYNKTLEHYKKVISQ